VDIISQDLLQLKQTFVNEITQVKEALNTMAENFPILINEIKSLHQFQTNHTVSNSKFPCDEMFKTNF
jgi:hypothetical protein